MKLINTETHLPLVEFKGAKTIFHSKYLEQEMSRLGIPIPPGMRSFYQGVDNVFLGDPDFQRAFREIYYITSMDPDLFRWE